MKRSRPAAALFAAALALVALAFLLRGDGQETEPPAAPEASSARQPARAGLHPGALHGRVVTHGGAVHEGRLRWGGDEEAHWSDFFNGVKKANTWAGLVPAERLPRSRSSFELFGLTLFERERPADLTRPFMARFGDLLRIEARGFEVLVTMKSGRVVTLDRNSMGDFDDGLRVWSKDGAVVDLGARQVARIEFSPAPATGAATERLHGLVRTATEEFTGFLQWDRESGLLSDELNGLTPEGERALPFSSIRRVEPRPPDGCLVTKPDGTRLLLSGTRPSGDGHRGVYVDDERYGRVLVAWEAVESVELSPGGTGPGYEEFPPGRPLRGEVITHDGRRLTGRLVFDLDESETTDTLDAPRLGVTYTIPFGRVAEIVPAPVTLREPAEVEGAAPPALVVLHDGTRLQLEPAGDLGEGHAGLLVFAADDEAPEYLAWSEVERIELEPAPAP